jgi:hypothetical protein
VAFVVVCYWHPCRRDYRGTHADSDQTSDFCVENGMYKFYFILFMRLSKYKGYRTTQFAIVVYSYEILK